MRRTGGGYGLLLLLLTSCTCMRGERSLAPSKVSVITVKPNDTSDFPKVPISTGPIHAIPLSKSYDHYVHSIPLSKSYDHYGHDIPLGKRYDQQLKHTSPDKADCQREMTSLSIVYRGCAVSEVK
jgi:hypothetical protein